MSRFLKKNFLTERRAVALEILGPGEWTAERFVEKMWGGSVAIRFGSYFLDGLVGLGLVESSGANGSVIYRLTDEGRGLLSQPPWKCGYCGASMWAAGVTLQSPPCRACKDAHRACDVCSRKLVVTDGEFPRYRAALKECPPGDRP